MDILTEFKHARPESEPFTASDADRLWSRIVDDSAADGVGLVEHDVQVRGVRTEATGFGPNVIRWDRPTPSRRRFAGLMAAAAVVVMVVGVALIQRQSDSDSDPAPVAEPGTVPAGWSGFPHPPIEPRFQYTATPTESGIFVWGGCCANGSNDEFFSDGAYYDFPSRKWRVLPAAPLDPTRGDAAAVWTGSEVLAINGIDGTTAAAFDPSSFTWRSVAPPPESDTVTNGGSQLQALPDGRVALADDIAVTIWDPTTDSWTRRVELDGVDRSDASEDWQSRFASTPTTIAVLTSGAIDDCSSVRVHAFDLASSSWTTFDLGTTGWLPSAVVGLDDTRFLVAGGFPCNGQTSATQRAAIVDTATSTSTWVAAPPVEVTGDRYGPTLAGGDGVFLGDDGRLTVYRPDLDEWAVGESLLDIAEPSGDLIDETPLVWLDGRIVIVSPGYGQAGDGTTWCCAPISAAWQSTLPTAATPTINSGDVAQDVAVDTPEASPESEQPLMESSGVMFANASDIGGIAGQYALALRTTLHYDVREPVNALDTADRTVVYARAGSEALATSVLDQLGLSDIEPHPMPANPSVEPAADLTTVGVLVMIGTDLDGPDVPDPSGLSVAIVHPPGLSADAHTLAEHLEQNGVAVNDIIETTTALEQTMLMPLGDPHPSSFVLGELLGIGGFDTWAPELIQTPLPESITDVVYLSEQDASVFLEPPS